MGILFANLQLVISAQREIIILQCEVKTYSVYVYHLLMRVFKTIQCKIYILQYVIYATGIKLTAKNGVDTSCCSLSKSNITDFGPNMFLKSRKNYSRWARFFNFLIKKGKKILPSNPDNSLRLIVKGIVIHVSTNIIPFKCTLKNILFLLRITTDEKNIKPR